MLSRGEKPHRHEKISCLLCHSLQIFCNVFVVKMQYILMLSAFMKQVLKVHSCFSLSFGKAGLWQLSLSQVDARQEPKYDPLPSALMASSTPRMNRKQATNLRTTLFQAARASLLVMCSWQLTCLGSQHRSNGLLDLKL